MPPRKPTNLRVLDGGAGHRVEERAGEKRAGEALRLAPRSLDKFGNAYWREVVPMIDELGLLHRIDRAGLIMLCNAYSVWQRALADVGEDIVVDGAEGKNIVKRNPALVAADLAASRFRGLMGDYGLTPRSRLALGVLKPEKHEQNAFDELLRR